MENRKHVALLYTYNRPHLLGRSIRCWLMQDYLNKTLCIYNNSPNYIELELKKIRNDGDSIMYEDNIILWNNHISLYTENHYDNLGEIYNDGLYYFQNYIKQSDVVSLWQDDDMYLHNHLNACNSFRGEIYKPFQSIYRDGVSKKTTLESNTFEGSWFIDSKFLLLNGFEEPSQYPEEGLIKSLSSTGIIVDKELPATYIYEWNNGVHHMSGGYSNHDTAFKNHRLNNNNIAKDNVVKIWSEEEVLNEINFDLLKE